SLSAEERDEALSGTAALAERLFGDEELTGASAGDVSFAVLHGLYWLAANLAARRPTAIVVDDLHWTDAPPPRSLAFLHRRPPGGPAAAGRARRAPAGAVGRDRAADRAGLGPDRARDPADRVERAGGRGDGGAGVRQGVGPGLLGGLPRGDGRQPAVRARAR